MLVIIFTFVVCVYFFISVLVVIGAGKTFKRNTDDLPSASVIVAARNEEENILNCLQSLNKLEYPEGKLEIIIVDDNSEDSTSEIVDKFIQDKSRFKMMKPGAESGNLKGKTNALAQAVKSAAGEIILTTDADCTVKPEWAKVTASYYTEETGAVSGITTQKCEGPFSGMQAIDFIYLLTVASGTANIGYPISAIGNNMSYRKKAYEEAGGYASLPFSVTEDFNLLKAISESGKYKIIHPLNGETLVESMPCAAVGGIVSQKKRWAAGGRDAPPAGFLVMITAFLSNLGILLTPLFFSQVWLYLAVFKISIDYFVLYPVHKKLNISKNLKYFIHFQIYYTLYVVFIPFISVLRRRIIWKGREY